ncbi:MAG: PQQ-like beta-propeller repeat protein, partial [Clostridia bacterium]|nr:PQQ-like beta-propeller repeat protein [Clostridia bacterium]
LEFTGYAIASGLSAYNRVAVSATRIDRYGKYVAALDDFKLTIINTENFDGYATQNIINKFVGNVPSRFALGNGTVLLCRGDKVLGARLDGDEETEILSDITALDLCYQSGFYYAAYTNGAKTTVVKIDEKTMTQVGTTEFTAAATVVTADVFGNIFVADGAKIYKRVIADGTTETVDITGVKKLATDLAGNLFALANGKIRLYDAATNAWNVVFETATDVKSFGMNFDLKTVNILLDGDQAVYACDTLDNAALSEFVPNADFTQATARKTALKAYVAGDNANIYSVTAKNGAFTFNGLIDKAPEYPLLAEITVAGHADLTLYALASEQGAVLINEKDLTEKAVDYSDAPERAFTITSVYAYALPVIERGGLFAIETDGEKIRLEKGTEICPENKFELLNKAFYSATVSVNGENVPCYIPVNFTAEIMSGNFHFDTYTLEKLKSTALYEFSDLTGEILTVENGETVKLLGRENGALKVAIDRGNDTIIGFVNANAYKRSQHDRQKRAYYSRRSRLACGHGFLLFVKKEKINEIPRRAFRSGRHADRPRGRYNEFR